MDLQTGSNELNHILERLVALHRNLLDVLREEYAHMSTVDTAGVAEAARAKEVLLSEIWSLEQVRIKTTEKLAATLGLGEKDATLRGLAERMAGAQGEKFRTAREALNLLLSQGRELNSRNMSFAQSSLERIEEMKRNALGLGKTAIKENYSNSGSRQPISEQGGRLLSTEA